VYASWPALPSDSRNTRFQAARSALPGPDFHRLIAPASWRTFVSPKSRSPRRIDLDLEAVFATPIRAGIAWREIGALFVACGGEIREGEGSCVRVALNGVRAVFHRPHPRKETDNGAVKSVRRFLTEAEI
jgi:HicA toxin of bacterial toxin-antitoxin,